MKHLIDTLKPYRNYLLALLALIALFTVLWGGSRKAVASTLKLAWKEGEVFMTLPAKAEEAASVGVLLGAGSTLRTGPNGKAVLETPKGVLRVGPDSTIRFEEVGERLIHLAQLSGRAYYRNPSPSLTSSVGFSYQGKALGNTLSLADVGAVDLSVNAKDNRLNAKALQGPLSVSMPGKTPDFQILQSGQQITIDSKNATVNAFDSNYLQSDWFKWNQSEDQKSGYGPVLDAPAPANPSPSTPAPAGTNSVSTPKPSTTPAPSQPKPVSSGSGCKPGLSAKRAIRGPGFQLSWTTCNSDDFQFYKLVRSTTNASPSFPAVPALVSSSNRNFTSYWDKSVAINQTYYYRACVVQRNNVVGCGNAVKMTN